MFTLKHVDEQKVERVVAVVRYQFDPVKNELVGYDSPDALGVGQRGDIVFTTGHVYVMNDAGKTVGSHNLWLKEQQNG